ncbi:MAG: WD40 repeat domain-containing protein [Candidatus Thorarchaeota archaeon]
MNKKLLTIIIIFVFFSSFTIPTLILIIKANSTSTWKTLISCEVHSIDISSNGDSVVANGFITGNSRRVLFFNRDSSIPVWDYPIYTHPSSDMLVAISADGNYVAATDLYERIFLFEALSGKLLWNFTTAGPIMTIAISSDGSYIVTGGNVGTTSTTNLYLFNKSSATPMWNKTGGGSHVDISSNGDYIVSAGTDTMYLFHRSSPTPIVNYTAPHLIYSIAMSSDGNYTAVGYHDYNISLYQSFSNSSLWNYHTDGFIRDLDISNDGSYIVAGSSDDNVYLFHKSDPIPIWAYRTEEEVWSVSISEDANYIVAGSDDNNIYLFHKSEPNPIETIITSGNVRAVQISDDGNYFTGGNLYGEIYKINRNIPYFKDYYIPGLFLIFIQYYSIISFLSITGISILLFTRKAIRKRRKVYEQEAIEEKKLAIEFTETLDKTFKKWEDEDEIKKKE